MDLDVELVGWAGVTVERWTPERRRQHTHDVLLDAATEVFGARGFEGASLEEIAETAGFTRGAIYKHFGNKEELFAEVNARFEMAAMAGLADLVGDETALDAIDVPTLARRWHELYAEPQMVALILELRLYVLRNPTARDRFASHRRQKVEMIAGRVAEEAAVTAVEPRWSADTLARVLLAGSDGIHQATVLEPADYHLFQTFLELFVAALRNSA